MSIFSIIFPLIFLVSAGYLASAQHFLNKEHITGLSRFTFYISVPAFLFVHMAQADLSQSFNIASLLAFYIPVISIFIVGVLVDRFFISRQAQPARHAVFALGTSYSNTVLVGLPIIIAALGEHVVGNVFMIITFHSALLFALTFLLSACEKGQSFSWRKFAKTMLLNPVVLSISSGIAINLAPFGLPSDLINGLSLLSQPAIACALFVLGANLTFYKISDDWQAASIASVIKLLLLPALVYLFGGYYLSLDTEMLAVVVLLSASPLGVNAYLVANQIQQHQSTLASSVVISTLLSVISFSFWLAILL
ncbi:hypothetical protein PULV_a2642 [Pseudoalteromonas ulvae UL12]|uniref:Transporter n=1 Tax=Pseudoalteromonas ulvae TaxID=107327 RepID=A0A244CP23_PSEDV|nr:AEC family transporter [Pseudoalteromonas ulvae]MBE0364331.1 hypothetical protein [Pseudoalteromonas ulvae UL12]OUL57354.1 transporter [Pseudoalteromonas ulvae]